MKAKVHVYDGKTTIHPKDEFLIEVDIHHIPQKDDILKVGNRTYLIHYVIHPVEYTYNETLGYQKRGDYSLEFICSEISLKSFRIQPIT